MEEAVGMDTGDHGSSGPPQLAETRLGEFQEKPENPVNLAQTMPYVAGDVIANKYRLTKVLGEGGMGAVWLARNLALEIDVAIKLIRHDYANAEGATRLLQEARAAARIGHPCIVRVFDFGTTERADPFIVMEVLQGESLAQTIARKGRLSAISAVRTLLPVAGALAAAHTKGIVHRDLKPDNIRLVTDERGAVIPKVVDFGIAKLHHDDLPRETTQAGVILGSPHYMSPEQACGRSDVDHRTDVWAFSVMLYEVITGKRPFEGPNYNALISSILVFQPIPWTERDVYEPELWALIQKGLAKEVHDRWQNIQEYGEALAIWAAQRDVETDAAGNSLRAHWLAAKVHRPLSEFPPASELPNEGQGPRPRMLSERDIRIGRNPSIPDISIPELTETNDPTGLPPPSLEPESAAPITEVPPTTASPQPSSEPAATTTSKPPEIRPTTVLIGLIALTVGAFVAGAFILAGDEKQPSPTDLVNQRPTTGQSVDKPVGLTTVDTTSATATNTALIPSGSVIPAASMISSVTMPSSAGAPPASASVRSPVNVVPKLSAKPPPGPPPIPTDPNF
jgi:eukaryotic-like serine/threonine-protein kinase